MNMKTLRNMDAGRLLRAVLCAFSAVFLIAAVCAPDRGDMLAGLGRIVTGPAQLTRDYFKPELGSISGALLNCGLVGGVFCALMFLPAATITGTTVLGYFLTAGFCFYGIHILNIVPLLLGVYVYSVVKREPFGKHVNYAMFSTAVAPLVSEVLFRYPSAEAVHGITPVGVVLALLIGLATGFAMPALCAHAPAFHKGFDLYNAGPAAGFWCMLLYALLYRVTGIAAPAPVAELGESHAAFVNLFCGVAFALCAGLGFALNGGVGDYRALLRDSGYRSDFTQRYGAGASLMNLGVYGLFILLYYNLVGASFNGVTMGAVFCMVCCCMNGATPLNVLPVMLGYGAMGLLNRLGATAFALNAQAIVVGLCFASGLAPISGEYGVVAGIVAGMLHYGMVTLVPAVHGGFNLYNGGFTAGIVCFVYVPLLEHWFKGKKRPSRRGAGRGSTEDGR